MAPLSVAAEGRWRDWDGLEPGLTDRAVATAFGLDPAAVSPACAGGSATTAPWASSRWQTPAAAPT